MHKHICVYVFDFLSLCSYTAVYTELYCASVGFAESFDDFEQIIVGIIRDVSVDNIIVSADSNVLHIETTAAQKQIVNEWIPTFEACEVNMQGNTVHSNIGKLFTELSDLKKKLNAQEHLINLLASGSKQLILHRHGNIVPQLGGKHNVRIYCYNGLYNFYIFGDRYLDYFGVNATEVFIILDHLFTHSDLHAIEIYDPDVPFLSDLLPPHRQRINIMIVNGGNMKLDRIINNTLGNSYREVTLIGFDIESTLEENLNKLYASEVLIGTPLTTRQQVDVAMGNNGRYDASNFKTVNLIRHFPVH